MPAKKITTWVLIADAARARILKNDGPGRGVDAVEGLVFENEHPKLGDIMADKPGRSFDSTGSGRHAMEYSTDAVREDEHAFAKSLAEVLLTARRNQDYDRLILIAAPRMLGYLRAVLPAPVKSVIHAEIDKDLTKIPNSDLPKHLEGVLSV